MALLLKSDAVTEDPWIAAFNEQAPELAIQPYPDIGDPDAVRYALVWAPPAGLLASLPNLEVIFSIGAGIDHILADPERPKQLPIVRMVEDGLSQGMSEFIAMAVLWHHRDMPVYEDYRRRRHYDEIVPRLAHQRTVGILGYGVLGADAAKKLAAFGFQLHGWSRSAKEAEGITLHRGAAGLREILSTCEIIVSLLPLTEETRDLMNRDSFALMPRGSAFINVGRGGTVVDADLIAALDSGQLRAATIDVFREEPLPPDHPFWSHQQIQWTPHIAAKTVPETAVASVVANIRGYEAGGELLHVVDLGRGY